MLGPGKDTSSLPDSFHHGPLRIVAIGGGTGLSTLLSGLKRYARLRDESDLEAPLPVVDITAVVTVTDDGGSSGRLRREFDVLPPGDIRNCMVALSEDEALMSKLFQHRFTSGKGLKGHSFGNLFLTALTQITGDFSHAVRLSSEVLASLGRIYPSTAQNVGLEARLANGRVVRGETNISKSRSRIVSVKLKPKQAKPLDETLEAIAQADVITLGPGSLYTSVIPNLLVDGIPKAIAASRAVKAYFVNLMWQPGETMHFCASDHVKALYAHAGMPFLNHCVVNTRPISASLRRQYAVESALPVENDIATLEEMGMQVIGADLLRRASKVRHDPSVAAAITVALAQRARQARVQARAEGSR
jgi:uncharacterized cofD-like protein